MTKIHEAGKYIRACRLILNELRMRLDLNNKDFAALSGVTPTSIGYYLAGVRPPNLLALLRLLRALPGSRLEFKVVLPAWEDMGLPERTYDLAHSLTLDASFEEEEEEGEEVAL